MKKFIACSPDGRIHYTVSPANDDDFQDGQPAAGDTALYEVPIETAVDPVAHGFDIAAREVYEVGQPPGPHHRFDYAARQWVDPRTLQEVKAQRWAQVRAARDATERGGFVWSGSTFDSDTISQSRIQGAAQLATLATLDGRPFGIDWTLKDNTVRTLNAQEMIAVGLALGAHVSACHEAGRALRAQIEAAETFEQVEAIEWAPPANTG